jgi:hypothetical protein
MELKERSRELLTFVVRTPQSSNFSNVEVGALGVSMNSNSDSEPFTLVDFGILDSFPYGSQPQLVTVGLSSTTC